MGRVLKEKWIELNWIFQFMEAKETGKRSASLLLHSRYWELKALAAPTGGTWKRPHSANITTPLDPSTSQTHTSIVARKGIDRVPTWSCNRRRPCLWSHLQPLWQEQSDQAYLLWHEQNTTRSASDKHKGAVLNCLFKVSCELSFHKVISSVDHHLHNCPPGMWIRTSSKPQPFLEPDHQHVAEQLW